MNNCELSDWENVTISTDSTNPTVMPYDGFLSLGFNSTNNAHFWMNGIKFDVVIASSDGGLCLPINFRKGDLIHGYAFPLQKICYYKKRDYSNQ